MLLFFVSLFFITLSSYFLTSMLTRQDKVQGVIYLPLFMFAQIVLGFEILSVFHFVTVVGFLLYNITILLLSFLFFYKSKNPFFCIDIRYFLNRLKNALILDKTLIILLISYLVFISVSLFLNLISPITSVDALDYHVARSAFWVGNQTLSHYPTVDIRQLAFPINSEVMYAWVILFTKKLVFLGMFSFVGYFLAVISIFNIMSDFCYRKRLWVIFLISSFSSVIVQVSGTETDIIIAGFVCASVYLFKSALKSISKPMLFMSSLAYALALGTKTPAFFAILPISILFMFWSFKKSPNNPYKPFMYFILFGFINFLIFSSYNYVSNLINFGNPLGSSSLIFAHKNFYGIKGAVANFIKHFALLFDFTGFRWGESASNIILPFRDGLLNSLNLSYIPDGVFAGNLSKLNQSLIEPVMGAGIIGIIAFIPALIISFLMPIFKRTNRTITLFLFSGLFILGVFIMSYAIVFMNFNIRFITFFMVIAAPILVYTYGKTPIKYIFIVFCVFYLTLIPTHIWARPFLKISKHLFTYKESITTVRQRISASCYELSADKCLTLTSDEILTRVVKRYGKNSKILFLLSAPNNHLTYQMLNLQGYKIDFLNLETMTPEIFKSYDLVMLPTMGQTATNVVNYDNNKTLYNITNNGANYQFKRGQPDFSCVYFSSDLKITNTETPFRTHCEVSDKFFIKNDYIIDYKIYEAAQYRGKKPRLKYVFYKQKK